MLMYPSCVVFFKQKTAYEMRIRDWSSDVCSSDLITSLQVLPGSANLVGGRGVTLKNVPATTYQGMKFPDAPWGLKMACGENPKRVYGEKGGPSRSEEHTSELQSLMRISYAVFCLKKKKKKNTNIK